MSIWVFPKNRGKTPQNGWFILENPIKMDDLGVPLFLETPIYQCKTVRRLLYPDLLCLTSTRPPVLATPKPRLVAPKSCKTKGQLPPQTPCLFIDIHSLYIYTYIYIDIQVHTSFDVKLKKGRYIICICI